MTTGVPPDQPDRPGAYEAYFGLNEPAFSLVPDPRFLFASASHSSALAQVAYALERREPLVVITGDIGTGKTLLCRTVLQRLPFKTFLSVITDPLLESDDLVKELLKDFGVIAKDPARFRGATRHELVQTLHAFLSSLAPIQAHAVVMIDEAQHLRPDVLEQIRLLSNIDDAHGTILQIILVGQRDLDPLLSRPELRQLHQRVSRRFALEPLNRDEVRQYIEHRLALASQGHAGPPGAKPGVEFTPDAIQAVSELSAGVPRVINLLCDRSLEQAFSQRARTIDRPFIRSAARALGIEKAEEDAAAEAFPVLTAPPQPAAASSLAKYAVLAVLVAVLAAAVFFGLRQARGPAAEASPPAAPTQAAPAPAAAAPVPPPPGAQPEGSPAGSSVSAPPAAAGTAAPATPAPAVAETRFEIVVASFRTDARATSVADEVSALGVAVRRRESDGWQQVIAGPFASRAAAEEAQQRIHGAGLAGTQVVPVTR